MSALIEREGELAALGAALSDAVSGRGRVVLIEGPGGIGKSSLLAFAVASARSSGFRVLRARGGELEAGTPWGVASQLLPVPAGDPFTALHGLFWSVEQAAEEQPLLITVDDAHLADDPSQQFLAFVSRRLDALPVALLVAARPRPGGTARVFDALATLPWAETLEPAPLGEAGVAALLGGSSLAAASHEVTGGNPQLVRELSRAVRPDTTPADVRSLAPRGVARAVLLELAAMPPAATSLVRAIAVLESAPDIPLAAALADLPIPETEAVLDTLTSASILTRETILATPADAPSFPPTAAAPPAVSRAGAVRFVHPIVREAVYADLPGGARDALHRRAARLLRDRGASPIAAAAHLLASSPAGDPAAVAMLRDAAGDALRGGAPATAVDHLRRALAEPAADRAAVLGELGTAEAAIHDPLAIEHLQEALDQGGPLDLAAVLAAALGAVGRWGDAIDVIDATLARLDGANPVLAARLEAELVAAARRDHRLHERARDGVERLRRRRADVAGLPEERVLLANLAFEAAAHQTAPEVAELALGALGDGKLLAEQGPESGAFVMTLIALWAADALPEARAALDEALEAARRASSPLGFVLNSAWRSHVAWRAGDLATAEADAQAVLDVSRELGLPPGELYGVAALADVLVERGDLDAADRLFADAGLDGPLHGTDTDQALLFARGRLRAAQGRYPEALADQLACGEGLARFGMRMPLIPWGSEAALAADHIDRAQAETLIDEELARARTYQAPRALGVALRAAGTLRSDRALLEEAVTVLERSAARLELAYALTALGEFAGRGEDRAVAIEALRRALDLADRCGATQLAARAREALLAAGARPRRARVSGPAALTASERRVAELAAAGHTNREIAQALFVTLRTVELHLTSTYRKLEVRSRADLGTVLDGR